MMNNVTIDGVSHSLTPIADPTNYNGPTVTINGVVYALDIAQDVDRINADGKTHNIADAQLRSTVAGLQTAIEAEIARAQDAEQANASAIVAEASRAQGAESALQQNITAEAKRAEQAENALDGKITAEVNRAKEAENGLVNTIIEESKITDDKIASEKTAIVNGDTIVGQAREIHSRNGKSVTDSFLVRTTAGSGTIGDGVASLKSVGGNIVKNLVDGVLLRGLSVTGGTKTAKNGIVVFSSSSTEGKGSLRNNKTPTKTEVTDHKYYQACLLRCSENPNNKVFIGWGALANTYPAGHAAIAQSHTGWQWVSMLYSSFNTSNYHSVVIGDKRTSDWGKIYVKNYLHIDLTEMFGAGKEPTKEECDRLFGTMDALPQGLTIANPTEFKSTGYNQADPSKVLVNKAIKTTDSDGNAISPTIIDGDKMIAVIPCLPCKVGVGENNGYCVHGAFDEGTEKVYLTPLNPLEVEGELYMHELTKDATTDTYVPQIKGYMLVEVPTTANLCAHFLWSEDKCERDSYEPYFESKVELPDIPQMSEWGLAGIQSSGTPVCDEIDFVKGVYVNRIGSVDLGNAVWNDTSAETNGYVARLVGMASQGHSHQNIICENYTTKFDNADGCIYATSSLLVVPLAKNKYPDAASFKAAMQGVMLYYELAEPEEYPLPKVDNNYISSDYGVEQFDSAVPCNANNLYYMRSLAGETRNFLDRIYANTDKTDAKEVADYITNGIESNKELATNAPNLALRTLFIAAGAEYNDTDQIIKKTAPWGTEETWVKNADGTYTYSEVPAIVDHLPGHYYLNGLGDITEEQMTTIYIETFPMTKQSEWCSSLRGVTVRTNLFPNFYYASQIVKKIGAAFYSTKIDVIRTCYTDKIETNLEAGFLLNSCSVKYIYGIWDVTSFVSLQSYASNNANLRQIKLKNLKGNALIFNNSQNIYKRSILYTIQNAIPTTAITITLHPDAYERIANQPDILEALEAQPLVTLVSA